MMKLLKTIGLTFILFLGFILPSCEDKEEYIYYECYPYFDIQGFKDFTYYKYQPSRENIMPLDTVSLSAFDVDIVFSYDIIFHAYTAPQSNFSLSLINTVDAFSCWGGYNGSKTEKIKSFTITTLNDFDDEHPANSNINDLFTTVDESNEPIDLTDYLNSLTTELIQRSWQPLKFKKAPTLNPEFNFKIRVELSTGEVYEKAGYEIYILP